jgi:pimeloyl-ACP methyl ester carboxylesterase
MAPLTQVGHLVQDAKARSVRTDLRASNIAEPTQFVDAGGERYAFRRFGSGPGPPLLFLQHYTGTLDNWDPAVTDPLATGREVILFDNAGVGRSSGVVPDNVAAMTRHALAFVDALGVSACDVLGFSLGGLVAQQLTLDRTSLVRRLVLVGTAPRGGEDIMNLEKPALARAFQDPTLTGYDRLPQLFFAPTQTSQAAAKKFIHRLMLRTEDREPPSGPAVAQAQIKALHAWETFDGERFADLKRIRQPALVINGVHDEMIPVSNSYHLAENLPNAVLMTYPDAGHGSLFQYHESFVRQVAAFLNSSSPYAPY